LGLGSLGGTWDILGYQSPEITLPDIELPGGGSFSFSGQFGAGLFLDAEISGGVFDLSYPIDYSVILPSTVQPGDPFTIDTNFLDLKNLSLKIDGPGLSFSVYAELSGEINASLASTLLGTDWNFDE
jgi:hypothetical protein